MIRTALALALAPALVAAALSTGSAPASAGCHLIDCVENVEISSSDVKSHSCEDLWVLRNSIYKDAGYCFKSPRAIKWFGNAGCQHDDMDDVPLSATMSGNVDVLQSMESKKGC